MCDVERDETLTGPIFLFCAAGVAPGASPGVAVLRVLVGLGVVRWVKSPGGKGQGQADKRRSVNIYMGQPVHN